MTTTRIPCPRCTEDLDTYGELVLLGTVLATDDPEGKARLDIGFDCQMCGARFNTFVAMEDFIEVDA